jgi:hypothetical protein
MIGIALVPFLLASPADPAGGRDPARIEAILGAKGTLASGVAPK